MCDLFQKLSYKSPLLQLLAEVSYDPRKIFSNRLNRDQLLPRD